MTDTANQVASLQTAIWPWPAQYTETPLPKYLESKLLSLRLLTSYIFVVFPLFRLFVFSRGVFSRRKDQKAQKRQTKDATWKD